MVAVGVKSQWAVLGVVEVCAPQAIAQAVLWVVVVAQLMS